MIKYGPALREMAMGRWDGLTADEIRRIMATQLPRAERLAQADDIIDNSGLPEALAPQVERLDRRYRRLAARFRAE